MARNKLARRSITPLAPYLPRPFVPTSVFPVLTRSLEEFNERTNEMIRDAFPGFEELAWFPAVNVSESDDEYTITAELPGLSAKDVTVDYCEGMLTIRGEKQREESKKEHGRTYHSWERQFGSFRRSFPFPGGIAESKIVADFKDGVLTVHLPKAEEAKVKHHKIPIAENK
jgi:HSP20 family protein